MDVTELPDAVAALADVPEEFRLIYVQTADGFSLHPEHLQDRKAHREMIREKEAQLAELEASVARNRELNRTHAASTAIASALAENGVPVGLRKGAASVISRDLKLVFEEAPDYSVSVGVDTPHGRTSVEHGVKTWLAGDGLSFAKPRPREVGKFTREIRALRDGLH